MRQQISSPWMLIGDFNEIISPSGVSGGSYIVPRACLMADMMSECGLWTWIQLGDGLLGGRILKMMDMFGKNLIDFLLILTGGSCYHCLRALVKEL